VQKVNHPDSLMAPPGLTPADDPRRIPYPRRTGQPAHALAASSGPSASRPSAPHFPWWPLTAPALITSFDIDMFCGNDHRSNSGPSSSSSDPARQIQNHLDEWLRRYQTAADIAPWVGQARDQAAWQVRASDVINSSTSDEMKNYASRQLALEVEMLRAQLPLPPVYRPSSEAIVSLTTTSSSMSMYGAALNLQDMKRVPLADSYALIEAYQDLQKKQDRVAQTGDRLVRLSPSLGDQLDICRKGHETARFNDESAPAAALEMRTLLDNVKGELFSRARRTPKENMTWQLMAERLAANLEQGQLLLEQGMQRDQIYDRLSAILKRRQPNEAVRIPELWTLVIDHLFVTVGCVV